MSKYKFLGKSVTFSEAEDNYYELQAFFTKKLAGLNKTYDDWYDKQNNAANIINNIEAYFKDTVDKLILKPLYPTLASKFSIYGIPQTEYTKSCMDISELYPIRSEALEEYEAIQEKLEEEIAEREEAEEWRKAGQISFGIGDTLKNAASNAVHGAVQAGGDAASRERAAQRRNNLYKQMNNLFWDALIDSLNATLTNHMNFVNEKAPKSIQSKFDKERSSAYLENAKADAGEKDKLLVEAFKACPWNEEVYSYTFKNYPDERKNLIEISKNYDVDLTNDINKVFRALYTAEAKKSEQLAVEVKAKILEIMADWGVKHSVVIDEIEKDCLQRLVNGVEKASEEECKNMKTAVEKYDALEKNKKQFFEVIKKRVEEIWASEDGEIFDNYLLNANILSISEVKKGIELVKSRGRTADAKKYQAAFEACRDIGNIKKARTHYAIKTGRDLYGLAKYVGHLLIAVGVVLILLVALGDGEGGFGLGWVGIFALAGGIFYNSQLGKMKQMWETITVKEKVINPILIMFKEEFEKRCSDALLADTSEKMKEKAAAETDSEEK